MGDEDFSALDLDLSVIRQRKKLPAHDLFELVVVGHMADRSDLGHRVLVRPDLMRFAVDGYRHHYVVFACMRLRGCFCRLSHMIAPGQGQLCQELEIKGPRPSAR